VNLSCGHPYCKACMFQYFVSKIESKQLPILCPEPSCRAEVQAQDVKSILDKQHYQQYESFILASVFDKNPDIFSCCPTPDCGYTFVWMEGDDPHFRCEKCLKHYCLVCKTDFHNGTSCLQYQTWAIENGYSNDLFNVLITGRNFKQCPACKKWIERYEGCDHMTCQCGHEFCFQCGATNCQCHLISNPNANWHNNNSQESYDSEEYEELYNS